MGWQNYTLEKKDKKIPFAKNNVFSIMKKRNHLKGGSSINLFIKILPMDLNTNLTHVVNNTQSEIERVLSELQELKAEMKRKGQERDSLAKDHRNQQIVSSKWVELLQNIEMVLAQACSAFQDKEVLAEQMRGDVETIFQRVIENFEEYAHTEIKETDAIVGGKVIKDAWNPKDYVAQITGTNIDENVGDDAWGAEVEVIEPSTTKEGVKMFLINNEADNDLNLWLYLQESIGISSKKRSLDKVAEAIADENISYDELTEYIEEYRKRQERIEQRRSGQQLKLKAI